MCIFVMAWCWICHLKTSRGTLGVSLAERKNTRQNNSTTKRIIATAERNIATAKRIIATAERNIATAERNIATVERIIICRFRIISTQFRNLATVKKRKPNAQQPFASMAWLGNYLENTLFFPILFLYLWTPVLN